MASLAWLYVLLIKVFLVSQCYSINLKYIKNVDNLKQYKKLLKTHTNVLTIYSKNEKSVLNMLKFSEDVAKEIRGLGTIVYINCGKDKETKKLCKKYNVNPMPRSMKHYKDGSFAKDYDRKDNAKSLHTFMLNPTGDAPWEEDPNAKDVLHINTEKEFIRTQRKEKGPMLIMFYAPWCGHCKKLKPDYSAAATELKGKAILAGMDCDKPDAHNIRYRFNITGYPTLIYFENGEQKYMYGGQMNKAGLVDWMTDPKPATEEKKEADEPWSVEAPEILHLTDQNFDEALKQHQSIIVMFYAPWCGHCKSMKPEYVEAAREMKEKEIPGLLAAIDCTKAQDTCKKYDVGGYPTVKYFQFGEYKFKLNTRKKDQIIEFMLNPEEPPAPPPEDLPWPDISGPEIIHLEDNTFKDTLKKKKHVLVMFYAPWCGHCKKAKPEIQAAAQQLQHNSKVHFAGVDCTIHKKVCEQYDVSGYPTFRYFLYGKNDFLYNGGRTTTAFIKFMENPSESGAKEASTEEQWKDTPSSVVHLEDDNFNEFINANPSVLIMFYAPWCGHCKSMKPAFVEAANELLDQQHVLAAIDCTRNRVAATKYDIKGYPTLKYFKNGADSDYEGGRSKDDLIKFFKSNEEGGNSVPLPVWEADTDASVVHLDESTFETYIKENENVFVMFYAPWCGHCNNMKPAYVEVAKDVNIEQKANGKVAAVDCTTNPSIAKKYGVKGYPTLKMFQHGKEFTAYKGPRTSEAILDFIKNPVVAPTELPPADWSVEDKHVVHLTDVNFENFVIANPSVLVMFYAPWCGHCKNMKPEYSAAAQIINTENQIEGKIAAIDCTKNPTITKNYEITGYPTIKYFKNGKENLKYDKGRTADAIVEFMKSPVPKPTKPPAPEWKDQPSHIFHLDEKSFDAFIKEHDALVMFYAPWCGHCNAMKPAYVDAAKLLHDDNANGVLAAVDATKSKDLASKQQVTGYPTLNYYRNGILVESYEKSRSVENLVQYVKEMDDLKSAQPVATARFEELPSSVQHLNEDNFHEHLDKRSAVLVMFHVHACEACREVRKEYMQAASRLSFSEQADFSAISCDDYKDLCESKSVTSYPTIQLYKNGKLVEVYTDEYLADNFVRYIVRHQQKSEL